MINNPPHFKPGNNPDQEQGSEPAQRKKLFTEPLDFKDVEKSQAILTNQVETQKFINKTEFEKDKLLFFT